MDHIIYNGAFTSVGKQVKCRTTVLLTFNLMGTIKMKTSMTWNCRAFSQLVQVCAGTHTVKAVRSCMSASALHISTLKLKLSIRILANTVQYKALVKNKNPRCLKGLKIYLMNVTPLSVLG
jgi:hypothetical protein